MPVADKTVSCSLCNYPETAPYHEDAWRAYRHCPRCALVFVPGEYHLGEPAERAVYDQHRNSPDDAGYRAFLSRLFEPMHARLTAGAEGLDFGCGPGPTLSVMFAEAGHSMQIYDKFYADTPGVLQQDYDFITCTEVVEHLAQPGEVLPRLIGLLRPGGWLGIMTKRVTGRQAFASWHYKNDPTHVSFFARQSLDWLAENHRCTLEVIGDDVVILQKPSGM